MVLIAFPLLFLVGNLPIMPSQSLQRVASYVIRASQKTAVPSFTLVISEGSVVDFSYAKNPKSCAIVNAANEGCLGGGGVDGAITDAGGRNLANDRVALPIVSATGARCLTGSATITGPNTYGQLKTPYVIHAVGPNFWDFVGYESDADQLLRSAYRSSLELAKERRLAALGFSLISAGVFRGKKPIRHVLEIAVQSMKDFEGYEELQEIHLCAFTKSESELLIEIAFDAGLSMVDDGNTSSCCSQF
jgi:O-acetyl-ADP-ribose deacetylase (regulator of RNase III)